MVLNVIKDFFGGSNKLERFWLLSKIEFKLRYYENILGLIWALIKPISECLIYYVAFDLILKSGFPQFVSYLFIGLILWGFFLDTATGTIQILSTKKYLYEYTNMNKIEIYISIIGCNLIGLFFNTLMFAVYFLLLEQGSTYFSWHIIFLAPIVLNLVILSLGFSLILSNIYIIAKDIQQVWTIVANLAFWLSPILFAPDIFAARMPALKYLNPFSSIVMNARTVIMYHQHPEWKLLGWGFAYSCLFLLIGLLMLNKLGSKAAEKL